MEGHQGSMSQGSSLVKMTFGFQGQMYYYSCLHLVDKWTLFFLSVLWKYISLTDSMQILGKISCVWHLANQDPCSSMDQAKLINFDQLRPISINQKCLQWICHMKQCFNFGILILIWQRILWHGLLLVNRCNEEIFYELYIWQKGGRGSILYSFHAR